MSITTNHRTDYSDMVWGLQIDGYTRSERLNDIDLDVAQRMPCAECGGRCRYEAWRRREPRGYRALSICRECGYAHEF